jgi:hypothetical protein
MAETIRPIPALFVLLVASSLAPITSCKTDPPQTVERGKVVAEDTTDAVAPSDTIHGYDFSSPDAEFSLDNDLREISGLSLFDDRHLVAIEDERGRFYLIDFETGKITDERKFGKKNDYEGVERAEDRLFVLRSDGQILEVEVLRATVCWSAARSTPEGASENAGPSMHLISPL